MQLIFSCLLLLSLLSALKGDDVYVQKRLYYPGEVAEPIDTKMKKPFCNAFTGCGKKRSDESLSALVDLNSEPAVEELSRQILSEAKLWEAIQEARSELINRPHESVPWFLENEEILNWKGAPVIMDCFPDTATDFEAAHCNAMNLL